MAGRRLSRILQRGFGVFGGMAGKSGRSARPGSADLVAPRALGTQRDADCVEPARRAIVALHFEQRRLSLQALAAGAVVSLIPFEALRAQAADAIRSVRMWPAQDY